jgi:hypothetical protein
VVDNKPEARTDPTRVDGLLLSFGHESQKEIKENDASG